MKVLAIRGRNLASLAGAFEVDFQAEPLAGAGLFAISGPTGAGKSTLLDALCLALYDDTPRLARADGRGVELPDVGKESTLPNDRRNILRRGCAEGHAEVDFVAGDGIAYRARWSVRRARAKADGKLQQSEMSLLRIADLHPVAGHLKSEVLKAIAERIGLSFEQFTRAVLLAQNEFFAFLKAGEDERAALLQTLTGTDRFEQISRRAFERNKQEQEKLRILRERLADQQPVSHEERAALETRKSGLKTAAARQEVVAGQLADCLKWHQDLARARQREEDAQAALARVVAERDGAAERRKQLARVDALQPARGLLTEVDRLAGERTMAVQHRAEAETATAGAAATLVEAKARVEATTAALSQGEATRSRLAPLLANARRLDVEIATLAPALAKAVGAEHEAAEASRTAQARLAENARTRDAALAERETASAWLDARRHLAPLAEGWMRWETLFAGSLQEHRRGRDADAELGRLEEEARRYVRALEEARTLLADATNALRDREAAVSTASTALAGFDADGLAQRRTELESRRQALHAAQALARDMASHAARLRDDEAQAESLRNILAAQGARREVVREALPVAEAEARQAEQAWRLVFEASQATAESLRRQLRPDAPCPVCGALEHPYTSRGEAFDGALARLTENLEQCRKAAADLAVEAQSLDAQRESLSRQLEPLQTRLAGHRDRCAGMTQEWEGTTVRLATLFPHTPPPAAAGAEASADWLAARETELHETQQALEAEEKHHRDAAANRQAAQAALESARQRHDMAREALPGFEAQAARTAAALEAASDARARGRGRLAELLDQLDAAHGLPAGAEPEWRMAWASDPAAYQSACQASATEWLDTRGKLDALAASLARLEAEGAGLAQVQASAGTAAAQARTARTELERVLEAARGARAAVFEGVLLPGESQDLSALPAAPLSTEDIEAALGRSLESARRRLAEAQQAAHEAAARHSREEALLAQWTRQATALEQSAAAAGERLRIWLDAFATREGDGAALDLSTLRALLAHDEAWIAAERAALQRLETAIAGAQGALELARAQREAHEASRPALPAAEAFTFAADAAAGGSADAPAISPESDTPEAIRTALDTARETLAALREELGGIELALRRDDEIRQRAATLLEAIDAQERAACIWWQMNELIGSADGKKFRNYAQQLTLDVLVGYANAHLADLARRYRLERVPTSLALMVIDQDMGDEPRSVHSLSGGESFLVSLALALGLASLSSHRVRVESLFIDEGFGSLDADTLRVAMDALDSLQALGRKVGVISHVQEMTERIGTRIQVRRLPGGQSRIEVCNGA